MIKDEFQKEQLKKFHSKEKFAYEEASIYTVLLDLVEGNGIGDVFMTLHNLATDLGVRGELEGMFEEAKHWDWDKTKK